MVTEPEVSEEPQPKSRVFKPSGPKKIGDLTKYAVPVLSLVAALAIGGGIGAYLEYSHLENTVVATVNGTSITVGEFHHRLESAAGTQVMQQMVTDDLRLQFADQEGASPSQDDINNKLIKATKTPDFNKKLIASHQTIDDIKHKLTVDASIASPIEQGVNVTEDDAKAFYALNTNPANPNARYYRPAEVQIAAIVTTTQARATEALNALAAGNSFATVAQTYNQLRGGQPGGLLPAFQKGRVDNTKFPGLEKLMFGLAVGQQTPITKIGNAFWIIRCVGKLPETTVPYDSVADECREGAKLTKGLQLNGQKVQQDEQSFQKSAAIKFNLPGYDQITTSQNPPASQ